MRILQNLLIACLVAVLSGCMLGPVKYDADEREQVYRAFQANQERLTSWQMHGRFSIRIDGKVQTGNITWVNNGDNYGIKLSGPLDQGSVIIAGNSKEVTLKDSQGYNAKATTPESLLSQYTQYEMPVSRLKYWIIGLPTPFALPSQKLSAQGYPIEMTEGEWRIEYQYFRDVGNYILPSKIIVHNPTMKITISVNDWKVGAPCKAGEDRCK